MKKALVAAILALSAASNAQTPAQVVAKALDVRNAPVCDALGLSAGCTDREALEAWCVANNKPAGAMCVASDTRDSSQRIVTAAQWFAEKQAEQDKATADKARRQRRATLVLIELAITDDAVRAAVCADAKISAADCK